MPRAYADVVGDFRQGEADSYARRGDHEGAARVVRDPEVAEAYARMGDRARTRTQQDEARSYGRNYAGALSRNDYAGAERAAAEYGDPEGVSGARTAQQQFNEQERIEAWRNLQGYSDEIGALDDGEGGAQGYASILARAMQESADSPELQAQIQRLPQAWGPGVRERVQGVVRTWQDRLLTPQQRAQHELTERQRATQERQADIAERRADAAEMTAQAAMIRADRAGGSNGEVSFASAAAERGRYESAMRGLEDAQRSAATIAPYAQQMIQRRGVANGNDRTVRTNDGILLMTVARMAQGAGVLSDQDLRTVQGSGLDAAIADAVGYINGGGQLSDRQRESLSRILVTRMGALDEAMWQTHDEAVRFAGSRGVDPASLGYRSPRVPRAAAPGNLGGDTNISPHIARPDSIEGMSEEELERIANGGR